MAQVGHITWKCDGCGIEIITDGPLPFGWLTLSYNYSVQDKDEGGISSGMASGDFHAVAPCLENFGLAMIASMGTEGVNNA